MSLPPMSNMWAPAWMGFSPVLANLRDYEFAADLPPIAVAAQAYSLGNRLQIDGDADFLVREIQFAVIAAEAAVLEASDIRVRLRSGDGRMLITDFMPIVDLNGPMVPPWPLRRGSVVLVDYYNANTLGSQTVWMVLKGWKRNPCNDPTEAPQPYVPMYSRYPAPKTLDTDDFEYPFTFTAAGPIDLLKQPLRTDNDADFLWSAVSGDWNTANNDVATVGNCAMVFYDIDEVPLCTTGVLNPWASGSAGIFRESTLSSGGGRPVGFYPSIFIPRGGIVQVDLSFGGAATVRFSLRGQKIYGVCK